MDPVDLIGSDDDLVYAAILKNDADSRTIEKPIDESKTLDNLQRIVKEGCLVWLAKVGADPAGYIIGRPYGGELEILEGFVLPKYRSAGVGTKLVGEVVEHGRGLGVSRIWTRFSADQPILEKLYEKAGFVVGKTDYSPSGTIDAFLNF